jgi:hypothetical protein
MTRLTAARFLWRVAIALATVVVAGTAAAQQPAAPVESGTYRLYKFEQPIGEETYSIGRDNDAVVLTDKFLFTDRGTRVPLDTNFRAGRDQRKELARVERRRFPSPAAGYGAEAIFHH